MVVTLYEGVADACMELGMSRRVVDESMISWLDLHLCTLQTEERSDTVRQTANHATKGGVAEMGLRVYYQRIDYLSLIHIFGKKICEGTPEVVKADQGVHEAYFGKGIIAGEAVK